MPSPATKNKADEIESHAGQMDNFQKANLANELRMMADNQRVLDLVHQRAKRFHEWENRDVLGLKPPPPSDGDDMKIAIDSPETHNHYPPAPSAMPSLIKAGLLAASIAVSGTALITQLPTIIKALSPQAVQTSVPSNPLQDYDLLVGPPGEADK